MDPDFLVFGTSIIVQGTTDTIPWYDTLVQLVGRRLIFYHNYKKMIINTQTKHTNQNVKASQWKRQW